MNKPAASRKEANLEINLVIGIRLFLSLPNQKKEAPVKHIYKGKKSKIREGRTYWISGNCRAALHQAFK